MSDRNKRKVRSGLVVSDKMDKTVVVVVESKRQHKLYKRILKTTKKYKAHDEENKCKTNDLVEIIETRPLSKDKRWRVSKVLAEGK